MIRAGLLALLIACLGNAAITHVATTCAGGAGASSDVTTSAQTTTAATLLTVSIGGVGTFSVSDSKGNTWNYGTVKTDSTVSVQIAYAWDHGGTALSVGSGHTITVTGISYGGACFSAWSGTKVSADPIDQQSSTSCNTCTTAPLPSITPTVDNSLVLTGITQNGPGTPTIDSGYSTNGHFELVGGMAVDMTVASLIQTTAAATAPTWSFSSSPILITVIASFLPGPSASVRRRSYGQ